MGDPLSPTIFNMVVDAVVCHWESLVVERARWGVSSGNDNGDAQPEGRAIWERDDGQRQAE